MSSSNMESKRWFFNKYLWIFIIIAIIAITAIIQSYEQLLQIRDFIISGMPFADPEQPYSEPNITSLSESLFCPIQHPNDHSKYDKMLSDIYHLQFNKEKSSTCKYQKNNQQKYYIFDDNPNGWGICSIWREHYIHQFTFAFAMNRLFLVHHQGKYRFLKIGNGKGLSQCQGRIGRTCFFKSSSVCTQSEITNLITNAYTSSDVFTITDETCELMLNHSIDTFEKFEQYTSKYKIIHYHRTFSGVCSFFRQSSMNRYLVEQIIRQKGYGDMTYQDFNMLALSFILRPQNNINDLINRVVYQSLDKYGFQSSLSSISMAVRASDKCWSHKRHGEMKCRSIEQTFDAIKRLRDKFGHDINTIILTSEDSGVISQFRNVSMSDEHKDLRWIFNDYDALNSPNSGNPVEIKHARKNQTLSEMYNLPQMNDDEQWFNQLISMLSTLKLQMNAKYVITSSSSNWVSTIWELSNSIHCEIDVDKLKMDDVANEKHCINFDKRGHQLEIDYICEREDRFNWTKSLKPRAKGVVRPSPSFSKPSKAVDINVMHNQSAKSVPEENKNIQKLITKTSLSEQYGKRVCKALFPDRVCFWPHHKTGVDITKQIFMETIFGKFCKYRNNYDRYWIRCVDNKRDIKIEPFDYDKNGTEILHKLSMLNVTDSNISGTLFHMTRDPLNTIISGFYYHMECSEPFMHLKFFNETKQRITKEFFAISNDNKEVLNVTEMRYIYEHLIYSKKYSERQKLLRNLVWNGKQYGALGTFDMYRWLSMWNIFKTMDYQNVDFYGYPLKNIVIDKCERNYNILKNPLLKDAHKSVFYRKNLDRIGFHQILTIIRKESLVCAVYFEFLRYLFETYTEQYEIYHLLNIKEDIKQKIDHHEIKMENFINNFDENMKEILDALNIIDNDENRMKLKENNIPDDIIPLIRSELETNIKLHDPNVIRKNASLKQNRHIHLERNNTLVMQELLIANNGEICLFLKYLSALIGYDWSYNQWCQ